MSSQEKTRVVLLACGSFNPITNMHLRMFELARDHLEDTVENKRTTKQTSIVWETILLMLMATSSCMVINILCNIFFCVRQKKEIHTHLEQHVTRTRRYRVVKGIISPVGDSYKKKGLIEACHRLEMARLATLNSDWITVDDWESQQPEWVETAKVVRHHADLISSENNSDDVDTVRCGKRRKLEQNTIICQSSCNINTKEDSPHLNLLCGADVLESFGVKDLWKPEDIEEIVGRYGVACITRCGSDPEKFINQSDVLYKHRKNIHMVREWVTNEISATHVRRALRRGQSVRYLLPDSVVRYIQEHSLYSVESEQKNANAILAPFQRYTSSN